MTQLRHTPAPWQQTGSTIFRDDLDGRTTIALAQRLDYAGGSTKEEVANAHLIAAAPELLEALEMAMSYDIPSEEMWHNFKILANKAIAKARGE